MINLLDILSEAEVAKCPAPTQNIELNLQNRQKAINEEHVMLGLLAVL